MTETSIKPVTDHQSIPSSQTMTENHQELREKITQLKTNLALTIVGKDQAIELVLVGLLSGGHVLLEDVPGVGKTLLAKSLARSIDGKFQRVQCTPDLLPTDITGTNIWNPGSREFEFLAGPIFTNVLLTDEINRATPRTQSALLEVMEEKQVTVDGNSRSVPKPFFVIATQNPVEYQGTFPLPEAQMDRFMLSLQLGYPTWDEELKMLQLQQNANLEDLKPIALNDVIALRKAVGKMPVDQSVQHYILDLITATREQKEDIILGASPRGAIALQKSAQAIAFIRNEDVSVGHIKELAPSVLSHRIIPKGGKKAENIIKKLLDEIQNSSTPGKVYPPQ
jgi:MoxR-like ATPase